MTTDKPSVAIYYGAEPFSGSFSFQDHRESARILDIKDQYDRVILDIGRRQAGDYQIDWLDAYRQYRSLRDSLLSLVMMLVLGGKPTTLYVGGIHRANTTAWKARQRSRTFAQALHELLEPIAPLKGAQNFAIAFDGSSWGDVWGLQSYLVLSARGDGHNVVVEGIAPVGHPLHGCPSLTTAAAAAVGSAEAIDAVPDPENHGIMVSNSQGLAMIPVWRQRGHPIYYESSGVGAGRVPPGWSGSVGNGGESEAA